MVCTVDGAVALVYFGVTMPDYPSHHGFGLISGVEDLQIEGYIQTEDTPDQIAVFADKVGHDPSRSVIVAVSVNKSQGASVIRQDRVMLSVIMAGAPAHLHELVTLLILDGEDLRPMFCTVISAGNREAEPLEILGCSRLSRFVTIHLEPIDIYTPSCGHGS